MLTKSSPGTLILLNHPPLFPLNEQVQWPVGLYIVQGYHSWSNLTQNYSSWTCQEQTSLKTGCVTDYFDLCLRWDFAATFLQQQPYCKRTSFLFRIILSMVQDICIYLCCCRLCLAVSKHGPPRDLYVVHAATITSPAILLHCSDIASTWKTTFESSF